MPSKYRLIRAFFYALLSVSVGLVLRPDIPVRYLSAAAQMNFETLINPDQYMVAPGDKFRIDFWDGSADAIRISVTPEGLVLLPAMGAVEVGNMNLTDAREKLKKLIKRFYSEADYTISLEGVRQVRVLVTGAVRNPGMHNGFASDRVSDMIDKAGGLMPGASQRGIKISDFNRERRVDILRFNRTGDLDANPYMYYGSKVYVPYIKDSSDFVQISGEVVMPGGYEYSEGDDLAAYIALALGLTGLEGDSIHVYRETDGSHRKIDLSISQRDFLVKPGDKVIIRRKSRRLTERYYAVTGEVNRPGRYPYTYDLRLNQVLEMAGSLTSEADIHSITIFRKSGLVYSKDAAGRLKIPEINSIALIQEKMPVAIDIAKFLPDRLNLVTVFPCDSVVVPALTGSIGIYGMVNRPGMVTYDGPGSGSHYIRRAGGYSVGADKNMIHLRRKSSGLEITTDPGIEIYDGDVVIVPQEKERIGLWQKLRDISLMVGGLAVVYLAVDNMTD